MCTYRYRYRQNKQGLAGLCQSSDTTSLSLSLSLSLALSRSFSHAHAPSLALSLSACECSAQSGGCSKSWSRSPTGQARLRGVQRSSNLPWRRPTGRATGRWTISATRWLSWGVATRRAVSSCRTDARAAFGLAREMAKYAI